MQRQMGRALKVLAWLSVGGGVAAAWVVGVPRLQAMSATRPSSTDSILQFVQAPAWLKGEDLQALTRAVQQELAANAGETLLSREDLIAAKAALEHSGWVTAVRQVERVEADRIVVTADFVTPFGLVRDSGGDHLIDDRGVLLPKTAPAGAMPQFMVMINPSHSIPSSAGEPWAGADVEAGLTLMRRLLDKPWRAQIASIDLSEFDVTGQLFLISDRGCRITWGAAPGREGAREVNAAQKIRYLEYHVKHSGHIDRGFSSFDLSGDYVPKW
jgi:hypothetical protein